jgi:hypothetical protein
LGPLRRDPKAGIGRHSDKSAHRPGPEHFEAGQDPIGFAQPLVVLKPELDQLPAGDGLSVNQTQLGASLARRFR